jgi:hypothetical protein
MKRKSNKEWGIFSGSQNFKWEDKKDSLKPWRDFKSRPDHQAISHHFWILINQVLKEAKLE